MKDTMKFALAALAATALSASAAYAATGTATATVVSQATLTETQQLSFGSFASGNTSGTVDTAGNDSGGVNYFSGAQPGLFSVAGTADQGYTINGDSTVTLYGPGPSMTADLTYTSGNDSAVGTGTLDNTGADEIEVAGNLGVNANQPAGTYTGTYNVTVAY